MAYTMTLRPDDHESYLIYSSFIIRSMIKIDERYDNYWPYALIYRSVFIEASLYSKKPPFCILPKY